MMSPRLYPGMALAAVILPVLGAGSTATAEIIHIETKNLVVTPAQVEAHVGDTIEWTNADFVAHTATARNHHWDVMLPPHGSGRTVVNQPGVIEYFCRFHPNMKGSITVKPQ